MSKLFIDLVPEKKRTGRELEPADRSKQAEVYYAASVEELVRFFRLIVRQEISREIREEKLGDAGLDSVRRRMQTLQRTIDRLLGLKISRFAQRVAERFAGITNTASKKRISRQMEKVTGIDITAVLDNDKTKDFFDGMVLENVQLIKGIQTEAVSRIQKVTQSMIGGGKTLREAGKEITAALDIEEGRGKRIAVDQSRKAMGDLNNLRMQSLGIKCYRWSAVMNKRKNGGTRPSHGAMHNRICRFDDPTVFFNEKTKKWEPRKNIGGVELHPSQDFNCRCTYKPLLTDIEGLEDAE